MIAELNIRHYEELLETETDPAKRRTIETLLAEERVKLAAAESACAKPPSES
jgi:hypothetical protein